MMTSIPTTPGNDFIELELLRSDSDYQPMLNLKRARLMAQNIDWNLIGKIVVNKRINDKIYHVIDGQHRVASLRMAGEEMAPCEIHYGLTPTEEAILFVKLQELRRSTLRTEDHYRALRASYNPNLLAFERVVEKCGLTVTFSASGKNTVKGTKGLVDFVYRFGENRMLMALTALTTAWPANEFAHNTRIIKGAVVYAVCFPENTETVASRWRHTDPKRVEFNARSIREGEGGLTHLVFAKALAQANNLYARTQKVDLEKINHIAIRSDPGTRYLSG
jgi:hypothetical protein